MSDVADFAGRVLAMLKLQQRYYKARREAPTGNHSDLFHACRQKEASIFAECQGLIDRHNETPDLFEHMNEPEPVKGGAH